MPDSFGNAFQIPGTKLKFAPGTSHDAGVRSHRNVFNLQTDADPAGGTTNPLKIAAVREGCVAASLHLSCSVSLSAINFTCGTKANPTKYATAFAGPGANLTVNPGLAIAALAMDPLAVPEDIYLFPSANLPAAGIVVARFSETKR